MSKSGIDSLIARVVIGVTFVVLALSGCVTGSKLLAPVEKRIISEIPGADAVQSVMIVYQKGIIPFWETEICFPESICIITSGNTLSESLVNLKLEYNGVQ